MKKKILMGIISLYSVFCITGCNKNELSRYDVATENITSSHSQYFDVEVLEKIGTCTYIVRDKNTNVLYLVAGGYYSTVMTPIYNEDGTLKIYKGDK